MNILTMNEAKAKGLKRYFTGVACPFGHIVERFVSTRACCECARGRKHQWNAENPDKANAQKRVYRVANLEKVKAWNLANQKLHRDSASARNRRWLAEHREQSNAASRAWKESHPEKCAEREARRRATTLKQTPPWADREAIAMIYRAAEVIRVSGFDVHVDHGIPLQGKTVRGLHVHNNLQIITANANRSKHNSFKEI